MTYDVLFVPCIMYILRRIIRWMVCGIQEYGVMKTEKVEMAKIICNPLMNKIQSDLNHVLSNEISDINHRLDPEQSKHIVITPSRHVRTRLYFTSESHIHCMINILRYGGLFGVSPSHHQPIYSSYIFQYSHFQDQPEVYIIYNLGILHFFVIHLNCLLEWLC